MTHHRIACTVLALALLPGAGAWAQGNSHQEDKQQHHQRKDQNRDEPSHGNADQRGAGPEHAFYRGERLPDHYRGYKYQVEDWRGHGLRAPPRGYHWVQTGGDYVLVAVATGVIMDLLLSR